MANTNLGGPTLGGGPFNGYSPKQILNGTKDSENVVGRRVVVKSWNSNQLFTTNGYKPSVGPFRAVNRLW